MTRSGSGSSSALRAPLVEGGTLGPVPPAERIGTLDILRGFALFGVLWSNLNGSYGAPNWSRMPHFPITLEGSLAWVQQWLIQDRFAILLGFLFGIGFAIQLRRAEAAGGNVRNTFCRRMLALLAFGVLHGTLIWSGDFLTAYALVGLGLVLYRGLSPRRLLVAAAVTYLLLPYAIHIAVAALQIHAPVSSAPSDAITRIYAHGTYAQITAQRVHDYLRSYAHFLVTGSPPSLRPESPAFLTLFVLGLWAERVGLASNLSRHISLVRRALWVALVCAALGFFILQNLVRWWPLPAAPVWHYPGFFVNDGARTLFYWGTAATYAAALTLLAQRSRWARRLAPLAAVGRMPLTTYLMQSIICTTLFYGYGFGWNERVGLTGRFVITLTVFAFQMAASTYWLRRFRFGPAEWLWRSLSYGCAQPLRVAAPPLPDMAPGQ